jgi:predicted ribosomally synthesized peptide with SipW-like signal peptide
MARHSLRIVIVLGALISLVGGTGIFAVFSDRATTGVNSVTSGGLGRAADLKIATASTQSDPQISQPFDCGTYTDDLATGVISFTTGATDHGGASLCIKNAGSASVDLTIKAIDLVDLDIDCTGDEAALGDTTCGVDQTSQLAQAGELSPNLAIWISPFDCTGGIELTQYEGRSQLSDLASTPLALGSLTPGQDRCFNIQVIDTGRDLAAQLAQSDQAAWRFAFDGTVPAN